MAREKQNPRYDDLISKIKNNRAVALLLVVGLAISSLALFIEASAKIYNLVDKLIQVRPGTPPLTLVIDDSAPTGITGIDWSIINTSDKNLELTSIVAIQLVNVDLCRGCLLKDRIKLALRLGSRVKGGQSVEGKMEWGPTRIFGDVGVYYLTPGESAPFSLQIAAPGNVGSVFHLKLLANDLKRGDRITVIPPYLFYYVGPPDYPSASLRAITFTSWLTESDSYLRLNAARGLGVLKDTRGEEALIKALQRDTVSSVRAAAAQSLSRFKSERSFSALLNTLLRFHAAPGFNEYQEAEVRRAAAAALGDRQDRRAVPYLLEAWRSDPGLLVANTAVESVVKLDPPGAYETLTTILANYDSRAPEEHHSRGFIVSAIGHLSDDRAADVLIDQLFCSDRSSQSAAADALGSESVKCVEALMAVAKRGLDPWSRQKAIRALGELQAERALNLLRMISSSDTDEDLRRTAKEAIQDINDGVASNVKRDDNTGCGEHIEQVVRESQRFQIRSQIGIPKLSLRHTCDDPDLMETVQIIEALGVRVQPTQVATEEAAMFPETNGEFTYPEPLRGEAEKVLAAVQGKFRVPIRLVEWSVSTMRLTWHCKPGIIMFAKQKSDQLDKVVEHLRDRSWAISLSYSENWGDEPFILSQKDDLSAKLARDLERFGRVEVRLAPKGLLQAGNVPVLYWVDRTK